MPIPFKSDPSAGRFSLGISHLIFAGAFALRLGALVRLTHSPLLLPSRGDMLFYNDWAKEILRGQFTQPLAFYGLPGYAYLLAALYEIFGPNPFVPGLFQAGADAGVGVLIYLICLRVFASVGPTFAAGARLIGLIAALGWAFFVPAQAYSVVLMPTALFILVFWFVVWRIVRSDAALSATECLVLSLLIGFTATAVATILAVVPLIFAALLFRLKNESAFWRILTVRIA